MKEFKLTDQDMRAHGGFQGESGKRGTTSGEGELCGEGWIHAYEHPLLAVFHNPIHVAFPNPRLFLAEGGGQVKREGLMKCGVTELTLTGELSLPVVTREHRVRYGIGAALAVYQDIRFRAWAEGWLHGATGAAATAEAAWGAEAAAWAAREVAWA